MKTAMRQRRESLGITQVALAKTLGVSQAFISEIELGKKAPGRVFAQAVAGALTTTVDSLWASGWIGDVPTFAESPSQRPAHLATSGLLQAARVLRAQEDALQALRAFGVAVATVAHARMLSLSASGRDLRASGPSGTFYCEYDAGLCRHVVTAYSRRLPEGTSNMWLFEDARGPEYTAAAAVARFIAEATR